MTKNHPFHLVDFSPWPILGALSAMISMMGLIKWFHLFQSNLFLTGMIITMIIMFQWWRDVVRESTYQGNHTFSVSMSLRWGMILFITMNSNRRGAVRIYGRSISISTLFLMEVGTNFSLSTSDFNL